MNVKLRTIEIDAETADMLEARAAARGMTLSELLADLAGAAQTLSPALQAMNEAGEGPWATAVLAEDARRLAEFERAREGVPWSEVKAWMQSWGKSNELPPPKPVGRMSEA